ncbi:MATE family efflux transporter [Rhodoferax koreense]|uniref:MATE family efflux transporter n=1 Tax=Rhodoferax koreensis TaxID=1842727 RepID=A0A1P8K364_9BURK|nr:MATE family efflux transporter [Rhodoferax koreense]APW40440.1 MATE family efflux transporter [Rhodoferax koreense]
MLHGPITPTLVRLAWPNLLMMLAQSGTGLLETWFISRLGNQALAGAALVTPLLMLMQNMSQGAMGGGISSAIARALGGGRQDEADRLVWHALALNAALGLVFSVLLLTWGAPLYRAMVSDTGDQAAVAMALSYSNVVFGGLVLMWVMNALASVVRGTGNMLVPGLVICGGALLLVPLSPCLIFGWGPFPRLGIAGAGWAMLAYYAVGSAVLGWYVASGRNPARLVRSRLQRSLMQRILTVGGLATVNPLLTNALIASTTALVGTYAGTAALAGYGTAARLEYLVIPVAFGIGAPLVAMVASNIGAGQQQRALRIALTGGALAFGVAECIGLAAALWPEAWLRLFGAEGPMLAAGSAYLRTVGPVFGFFGAGFALYFASQGAGRLGWPLFAGAVRLVVTVGGGGLVLHAWGSLAGFFAVSAVAMVLYGAITVGAVASGRWFARDVPPHHSAIRQR